MAALSMLGSTNKSLRVIVALSFLSMILGIGREVLQISLLGFTNINDQLQTYLMVIYVITFLGDPIRLTVLNQSHSLLLVQVIIYLLPITICISFVVALISKWLIPVLSSELLAIVAFAGLLNLLVVSTITFKQQAGATIPAQIVSIAPNFLLMPGILVAFWLHLPSLLVYLVLLYMFVPILQLVFLSFIKTQDSLSSGLSFSGFRETTTTFISHSISSYGKQIFNILVRSVFLRLGDGYLSALVLIIRTYDTLVFALTDSYISANLAKWKQAKIVSNKEGFLVSKKMVGGGVILSVASLCISFVPYGSMYHFIAQLTFLMLVGFIINTALRVIYFRANVGGANFHLAYYTGVYELVFAFAGFSLLKIPLMPVLVYLWAWFIVKPLLQIQLVKSFRQKQEQTA